jgi:carbohydrate-selective porin OprB
LGLISRQENPNRDEKCYAFRMQLDEWFYAQPVLEYILRPNGTGLVENASVLGFQLGAIF